MENYTFEASVFTSNNILPEAGEEVTTLWGRKAFYNLIVGYGIVGTIRLDSKDLVWLNLGLTRKFEFPPTVYCYYRPSDFDSLISNTETVPTLGYFGGINLLGVLPELGAYYKRIAIAIDGDNLGFRANLGTSRYLDTYFRIHGV